jgi:cobalt-zinc-cadmium efflux system protein
VAAVRGWLGSRAGVVAVHDLHIWPISATHTALTAHLIRPSGGDDGFLHEIAEGLRERFGIAHATIQLETTPIDACEAMHA